MELVTVSARVSDRVVQFRALARAVLLGKALFYGCAYLHPDV